MLRVSLRTQIASAWPLTNVLPPGTGRMRLERNSWRKWQQSKSWRSCQLRCLTNLAAARQCNSSGDWSLGFRISSDQHPPALTNAKSRCSWHSSKTRLPPSLYCWTKPKTSEWMTRLFDFSVNNLLEYYLPSWCWYSSFGCLLQIQTRRTWNSIHKLNDSIFRMNNRFTSDCHRSVEATTKCLSWSIRKTCRWLQNWTCKVHRRMRLPDTGQFRRCRDKVNLGRRLGWLEGSEDPLQSSSLICQQTIVKLLDVFVFKEITRGGRLWRIWLPCQFHSAVQWRSGRTSRNWRHVGRKMNNWRRRTAKGWDSVAVPGPKASRPSRKAGSGRWIWPEGSPNEMFRQDVFKCCVKVDSYFAENSFDAATRVVKALDVESCDLLQDQAITR